MKVKDLISKLSSLDPELDVAYELGYGTYTIGRVSIRPGFKGKKSGALRNYSDQDREEEKVNFVLLAGER